jgi:Tfp pilus assembly protein PilN
MSHRFPRKQRQSVTAANQAAGSIREIAVVFSDREQGGPAVVAYWEEAGGGAQAAVKHVAPTPEDFARALGVGIAPDAIFRIVDNAYVARTRVFQRGEDLSQKDDDYVNNLLIEVAADASGEGSASFFDENLDRTACDWSRLPDGEIAVTDLPREHVESAGAQLRRWLAAGGGMAEELTPAPRLVAETTLRAMLRFYLESSGFEQPDATDAVPADDGAGVALLAVGSEGFAYGLWGAGRGLLRELHEQFLSAAPDEEDLVGGELDAETLSAMREAAIGHAISRLSGLVRDAQSKHNFDRVDRIVCALSAGVAEDARAALLRYAQAAGLPVVELPIPLEEAVVQGLALGVYETSVPVINLAGDLRHRADEALRVEESLRAAEATRRHAGTLFSMTASLVAAVAFICGSWAYARFQSVVLARDHDREVAEQARLKPIAAERKSAVENIKWFQTAVSQTLDRRSKQASTVRLFDDLNARWPSDDSTWYVKEMTVSAAGALEIKGLTKREESVTAFNRSLEFSGGLFNNAYPQVVSGAPGALPGSVVAGLPPGASNNIPPGVTSWIVKAVYSPLAAGAPNTAAATTPGQPAPPAATTVPAPAAPGGTK